MLPSKSFTSRARCVLLPRHVAGHGRRHPGHPVQGRSFRRALRRRHRQGIFQKGRRRHHRRHFRRGRRLLGARRDRQRLGYGETSPAGIIAAINEGQDIKIVDIGSRSLADNVIIVMPNSPIKTMADLKGKKFAISNPKSLGEMTAVLAAEKVGLDPTTSSASRSAISPARSRRWKITSSMRPAFPASCS